MGENSQEANDLADNGHSSINRIMLADFKNGKKDKLLGALYLVYNDHDIAYHKSLPNEPVTDNIESFDVEV